jgi:hypothetical protein
VHCGVCRRTLRVKLWQGPGPFVTTPDDIEGIALICGDCGQFYCAECATPDQSYLPTCDDCRLPGGVTFMLG